MNRVITIWPRTVGVVWPGICADTWPAGLMVIACGVVRDGDAGLDHVALRVTMRPCASIWNEPSRV